MEKKIATSLEVLIKVAQYENIRLTKYAEAKIEYGSEAERIEKENQLQAEVSADLVRSLNSLPTQFSKAPKQIAEEFSERTAKIIPEWLENGPEPNIADNAKKANEKAEAEIHASEEQKKEVTDATVTEMEELFGPDEPNSVDPKSEEKPLESASNEPEPEISEDISEDVQEEDFDDDEDLFA